MSDAINEVKLWLEKNCQGGPESIEVNIENQTEFMNVMKKNKLEEKNAKLIINQLKREISEYKADESYLSSCLSRCVLSTELYDKKVCRYLHSLSIAANELQIQHPNMANILIAISNLNQDLDELSGIESELNFKTGKLETETHSLEKQNLHLERVWENLEANVSSERKQVEKKLKSLKFSTRKLQQNTKETSLYNDKLKQRGFNQKFSQQNICEKNEQYVHLKEESDALKLELETYQGLPPNIQKAREELKKKNNELLENENEFSIFLSASVTQKDGT